jgi:hypothetical protein
MTKVLKYTSMNPDEYKEITEEEAKQLYFEYLYMFVKDRTLKLEWVKNYQDWLDTEI